MATWSKTANIKGPSGAGNAAGNTFYGLTLDKGTALVTLTTIQPDSGTVVDLSAYQAYFFAADGATFQWNSQRLANLLLTAKV